MVGVSSVMWVFRGVNPWSHPAEAGRSFRKIFGGVLWHNEKTLEFERSFLEPCWLVKRSDGKIAAMVLIEVDDINLAVLPRFEKEIKEAMSKRFKFGEMGRIRSRLRRSSREGDGSSRHFWSAQVHHRSIVPPGTKWNAYQEITYEEWQSALKCAKRHSMRGADGWIITTWRFFWEKSKKKSEHLPPEKIIGGFSPDLYLLSNNFFAS